MRRTGAAVEGFAAVMVPLAKVSGGLPSYTALSRREAGLDVGRGARYNPAKKHVLTVDAKGLKVFGEGEWKVRTTGTNGTNRKRRTWRKTHLLVDCESGHIISVEATESACYTKQHHSCNTCSSSGCPLLATPYDTLRPIDTNPEPLQRWQPACPPGPRPC